MAEPPNSERRSEQVGKFQAEFSIHDTVLTRALDIGDFKTALVIVRENSGDTTLINDGPYERFPLYIVLCGQTSEGMMLPRNLQFAKVLLNQGADPNKRVPTYDPLHGIRSSMTPIEVLVNFYYTCQKLFAFNRWEDSRPDVIGLDGKVQISFHDVRHHLLQLLSVFIDCGAKLCLAPDETGVSLLNHMLWTYPDVELVKRLVKAGVDVNSTDIHLQTAIFALCFSFSVHLRRKDLQLLQREVLAYLLRETSIKVQAVNCQSQSGLWVAMSVNRFDLVETLLAAGATDEVFGYSFISTEPMYCVSQIYIAEKVPAVLVPFITSISDSTRKSCCSDQGTSHTREAKISSHVSYLVDKGYFNKPSIEDGIIDVLCWNRYFKPHQYLLQSLKGKGKMVPSLFGRLSTSLVQLCVRKIFHGQLTGGHLAQATSKFGHRGDHAAECEEKRAAAFDLKESDLRTCLQNLSLPLSFLPAFELELFHEKLVLAMKHSVHGWVPCSCAEDRRVVDTDSDVTTTDSGNEGEDVIPQNAVISVG